MAMPVRVLLVLLGVSIIAVIVLLLFVQYARSTPAREFDDTFEANQLNTEIWRHDGSKDCSITLSDVQAQSGSQSVRFEAAPDSRCELVSWPADAGLLHWVRREPFGQARRYRFSVYLPADYKPSVGRKNEVIAQWHSSRDVWLAEPGGQGPPLALRIRNRTWFITHGFDKNWISEPGIIARNVLWQGSITPGAWTSWTFDVRWSLEQNGWVRVTKDGVEIAEYHGPLGYRDLRGVYLKVGLYHPREHHVIYIDDFSVSNLDDLELSRR